MRDRNKKDSKLTSHWKTMERFTITRVSNKDVGDSANKEVHRGLSKMRNEIAINVGELNNMRRNSRTVPNLGEARKFSLAQLTRFGWLIKFLLNPLTRG